MKLNILGVEIPVSDKVIYATEEASREYIKAMKEGITQEWKAEFDKKFSRGSSGKSIMSNIEEYRSVKDFIESLLKQSFIKYLQSEVEFLKDRKKDHCGEKDCRQGQCINRMTRNETIDHVITHLQSQKKLLEV